MLRILLFLLCFSSLSSWAQSAYPRVEIFKANTFSGCSEPSIAIDPSDPSRVVAGSVLNEVHYSSDSGKTWTNGLIHSSLGVWGDPCVIADGRGDFYFFHLSDPTGENWRGEQFLDRMVCQRSSDGGKTWNDGSYFGLRPPKQQDKEWVSVSPNGGRLYASWTEFDKYGSKDSSDRSRILFTYSADRGDNWSEPVTLSANEGDCLDDDMTTEGAVPAAGPHGEVYVSWAWNGKIWFNRSLDEGNSWWKEEKEIASQSGGWTQKVESFSRINGMPVTVCDQSDGPFRGTVYVLWGDDRNGNLDIWIKKSLDKGETWSEAQKVNDDSTSADQFLPWVTIDPVSGTLYSVFYDRRHSPDSIANDVYLAWSKDAGSTWVNERLTDTSFATDNQTFIGDYNNISAYDGMVRPIWVELREGRKTLWTALIKNVH